MATAHYLHFNARGAVAMRPSRRGLEITGRFGRSAEGGIAPDGAAELFRRWRGDRFTLLVDSVDEELHLDEIPKLRAGDRQRMLGRRIAQRFRDRRLATALLLDAGERRWGWRSLTGAGAGRTPILIAGIPIDADLQAWTALARTERIRIGGVHSPALLSHQLAKRIGGAPSGLLLTVQPAGIRQTLLIDGQPRFTRLAVLPGAHIDAKAICAEVARVVQYLLMSQLISRDLMREGRIGIWVVTDGIADAEALPQELVVDNSSAIEVHSMSAARLGGPLLHDGSDDGLPAGDPVAGLSLWSQPLLAARTGAGYANREIREADRDVALRRQALGIGAGALVSSLCVYGAVAAIEQGARSSPADPLTRAELSERASLREAMGRWPVAGTEMAQVVAVEARLRDRAVEPDRLLAQVAQALSTGSDLRLVSLAWSRGRTDPRGPSSGPALSGGGNGLPGVTGLSTLDRPPGVGGPVDASAGQPKLPPLGSTPLGAPPLGASRSGPGDAPAGAADELLTVRIRAEIGSRVSKAGANRRADAFARAIGDACRCDATVSVPPYNAEPATGFSAAFNEPTREAPRFTVEMRFGIVPARAPDAAAPARRG